MSEPFLTGIDVLLQRRKRLLSGKRVGLLSHVAALDVNGCTSAERLWRDPHVDLTCILGPEHGFFGLAAAGESCRSQKHPTWKIPVFSLYGKNRKPTRKMMERMDVLIVDLQDIGARSYTYISTIQNTLEAAAEAGVTVVVTDRPIPLPNTVDGPITQDAFRSFVAQVDAPLSYGMTPGEAAQWIKRKHEVNVDLRVVPMSGYNRQVDRPGNSMPWMPPSPAMRSWESAQCFPATVCFEALPAIDHGRATNLPFQLVGSWWMKSDGVCSALQDRKLPGVQFYCHRYDPAPHTGELRAIDGVRMVVTDPNRFQPALTAITLITVLQELYGKDWIWRRSKSRVDFFDKLFGTDSVRLSLLDGGSTQAIASEWTDGLEQFKACREKCLLYQPKPS